MKIKAIIFDLDGTLIDSMGLWREVDEEFLSSRGVVVPEDLFDNLPSGNSFIQTAEYFRTRFGLTETNAQIMKIWTEMVAEHYANSVMLKAGVAELLPRIKAAGLKLGLATSNSYELARSSLTFNAVWDYFDAFSTGDADVLGKPFPDIYLNCAKDLGLEPAECIAIEDTLTGVQAAQAAGMQTLAIYDEDSKKHHDEIKKLALAFCLDYPEIIQNLRKLRVEI
ncbi:MAG: HAD family phosphatase [Candidatus Cloacimonetes bacterium]|nr:HAD family phosphatase [Candidatus Cloacimonadota bacterium]MDY0173019.1 HAD family phosphatase [Candidatus Cloacimonadaceae bacterium]